MITDHETNYVYLSDLLPRRFPELAEDLRAAFQSAAIPHGMIPDTKDIWCRDYMPIQVGPGKFVQFRYHPDYLRGPEYQDLITPPEAALRLPCVRECVQSELVVDGGNVVRDRDKVIMTDAILYANPGWEREALLHLLADLLEVKRVILIPPEPLDVLCHADGVVRFVDDETVLVNDYSRLCPFYRKRLHAALQQAGLRIVEFPFSPDLRASRCQADIPPATGVYVNFLMTETAILAPAFGLPADEAARQVLAKTMPGKTIIPVDCTAVAKEGGLLNCISWTIRTNNHDL